MSEFSAMSVKELIEQQAAKGFDVIVATSRDLLLDLDTGAAVDQFKRVRPWVEPKYPFAAVNEWKSKSGNTHVQITLKDPLSVDARIALQLALGSDIRCEILRLHGSTEGRPVIVLFKPIAAALPPAQGGAK